MDRPEQALARRNHALRARTWFRSETGRIPLSEAKEENGENLDSFSGRVFSRRLIFAKRKTNLRIYGDSPSGRSVLFTFFRPPHMHRVFPPGKNKNLRRCTIPKCLANARVSIRVIPGLVHLGRRKNPRLNRSSVGHGPSGIYRD